MFKKGMIMMIKKLRELNKNLINKYQDDDDKLKKQLLIEKLLKDDLCFFKIKLETAYSMLSDLGFESNDIDNIYLELIDKKYYKKEQ